MWSGRARHGAFSILAVLLVAGATDASDPCEIAKLLPSQGSAADTFGSSVDLSGEVAIVGGFLGEAAYVYRFDGSAWAEEQMLVTPDPIPYHNFGVSVAIDGNLAVVGAFGDDDNGNDSGAVYIFRHLAGNSMWPQSVKLLAPDGVAGDWFGWSVALSGTTLAVGALGVTTETSNIGGPSMCSAATVRPG
jgi:hypothetical protein